MCVCVCVCVCERERERERERESMYVLGIVWEVCTAQWIKLGLGNSACKNDQLSLCSCKDWAALRAILLFH